MCLTEWKEKTDGGEYDDAAPLRLLPDEAKTTSCLVGTSSVSRCEVNLHLYPDEFTWPYRERMPEEAAIAFQV
jgi:hypothetical protein